MLNGPLLKVEGQIRRYYGPEKPVNNEKKPEIRPFFVNLIQFKFRDIPI